MTPFHKYMLLYTSLQIIGIGGILQLTEWEKRNREKLNK